MEKKTSIIYRILMCLVWVVGIIPSVLATVYQWVKANVLNLIDFVKGYTLTEAAHKDVDRRQNKVNKDREKIMKFEEMFKKDK
jgi:hypothetical protein